MELQPVTDENIEYFAYLLFERNKTLEKYTHWKYAGRMDSRFKGVIAIENGKPAACFGSVPKELVLPDGTSLPCGWFADWYVSPKYRGFNLGSQLLNSLSEYESLMFGHPGPAAAQKICLNNGYEPVGFNSRRRLILRPWIYHLKRGTLWTSIRNKLFKKILPDTIIEETHMKAKDTLNIIRNENRTNNDIANFRQSKVHTEWIKGQPIANPFRRRYGELILADVSVKYFDEFIVNNEKRRLILYMKGKNSRSADFWHELICLSSVAGNDYIEFFTTDPIVDKLLNSLGAWNIYEPPILVQKIGIPEFKLNIQPWDRENWTYLATHLYK